MRSKKLYIIILCIIIIFSLVLGFSFGKGNLKKQEKEAFILVGDETAWHFIDNQWVNVFNNDNLKKLSWMNYDVYINNNLIGNYSLMFNDKWYVFNDNKESIKRDGSFFAIKSNYDIAVANYKKSEINNFSYVNKVLRDNNLYSNDFTVSTQITFDLDNDQVDEDLYIISNAFPIVTDPSKIFSIVFMVKNNKIYYLYKNIMSRNAMNGCKPYLSSILDTDNDGVNEIILSCGGYSTSKPIDMMYKFSDDNFKIIVSN